MTGKARMTFRFDRPDPRLPGKERPPGGDRHTGNRRSLPETRPVGHGPLLQDDVDQLERLIRGEDPQVVPLRSTTDKPAGGTPPVPVESGIPGPVSGAAYASGAVSGAAHDSGAASGPSFPDHELQHGITEASDSLSGASRSIFRGAPGSLNGVSGSGSDTLNDASAFAPGDWWVAFGGKSGTRSGTSASESGTLDARRPAFANKAGEESVPPPSGIRVFLAVAGAVATGAVFGYLVLWLFTVQPWVFGNGDISANPQQQSTAVRFFGMDRPSGREDGDEEAAGNPDTGVSDMAKGAAEDPGRSAEAVQASRGLGTETLAVPADLFYFLQYGVFSSEERMKEALGTVRNKGFAAVAAQSDGYRVFVGAAATRDDAERLAKLLGNFQVYIKVLDNPPLILPADGFPPGLPDFFERSGDLARQLARLSLVLLKEGGPPPEEDWQRLQDTRRQWRQAVQSLEADPALTGDLQTLALRAAGRLDEAVTRLEEGRSGQDRSALWDVQSATMEALLDLTRLRETLRNGGTAAEAKENASG